MSLPAATSIPDPYRRIVIKASGNDDTSRLQAALNTLASKGYSDYSDTPGVPELVIDGLCKVSSGLTYPGNPAVIRGATPYSGIQGIAGSEAADLLTIGDGLATHYARAVVVRELRFTSAVTKTAGAAIKLDTCAWCRIVDNSIVGMYDGIYVTRGSQQNWIQRNGINAVVRHGILIDVYDHSADTPSHGYGTEVWVQDNALAGNNTVGAGIKIEGGDALRVRGNSIVTFKHGLWIAPSADRAPEVGFHQYEGNIWSDCYDHAVKVDGTNQVAKLTFTNCIAVYGQGGAGYGVYLTGAKLKGVTWLASDVQANPSGGVFIGATVRDTQIKDSKIFKNAGSGIELEAAATDFMLVGNRITNNAIGPGGGSSTQNYGIKYGGSHDNCIIMGNDLRGNATAGTTGTAPNPSSTVVVTGNI